MYTQDELKMFADVNNGAISKEIGEGIIRTFNPDLAKLLLTAAKPYYAKICMEVAIGNYRANGITSVQSVELIIARYLYDKLPVCNRRQLLKLPLHTYAKESVRGWLLRDVISARENINYEWEITIPAITT